MSTKQLYEKTSEGMKEVSPLVAIEDIYSKLSDTPLEALVSLYNHVKCEWKGSVADTRRTVPLFLRRSGLFITYNNGTKYITEFFSAGTDQITTESWIKDSNWTPVPDEDYISAGVKPGVGTIGYEQLSDKLKQLFREKVNATNFPDNEDIASIDNMLKLKDREVDVVNFQSKGYVILRKNLRLINGVVKNILTQNMINQPNTIYEIRYDFDLNGETIEMQEGCTLKFEGGCFKNGILKGNNTHIVESKAQLFDSIILRGSFDVPFLYYDNFGVIADTEDNNNSDIINKTNDFIKSTNINTLTFASSLYYINKQIVIELNPREETLNMIGHSVTIKATESFSEDYLLRINYTSFATTTRTLINGFTFDCNVLTGGINIPNGNCIKIYNVAITNIGVEKNGIFIRSGAELHFSNSRITGNNIGNCFGICFHTSDCSADNIVMIDVKTAIYQSGSSNIYSDIHAWISSPQNFNESEFLLIEAGFAYLDRCSCDTYQRAIYSINNPFVTFNNSSFFQNTTVVNNASDKNSYIIIEEGNSTNSHYSFSGCNIYGYSFQKFSNNDDKIKKRCNFAGSLLFDKFYTYNAIPEIPFAQYNDITGVYKDGLFKSNDMRKLPQQINPTDGHLYSLFNFSDWQGKQVIIMGINYTKVFVLAISGYNNTIRAYCIYGVHFVSLYTRNSILYLSCPKRENTHYNTALIFNVYGITDLGEKEVDETYTKVDFVERIGTTENRPLILYKGCEYYDTTLKKKILWDGTAWVNLDGSLLNVKKSGTTAERPANVEIGFIYKDITLNKLILWEGTKWVNFDGTDLI